VTGTGEPGFENMLSGVGTAPNALPERRRRRKLWPIILGIIAALLAMTLGGAAWTVHHLKSVYDSNIERFPEPFSSIPSTSRPTTEPGTANAVNLLLLGSDSRVSAGDPTKWQAGAQRTDAIMIVHIAADRKTTSITSIPRDSWVPIPGHGHAKINAAFSYGGPTLMVRTIENLTGIRIDHVAIVDFTGFTKITDAVGGVTIDVAKSTHDERATFTAGPHHMDGATALNYVRQRHNLPGGDFDRVKRQQNWIRAVMNKMLSAKVLTNPFTLTKVLGDLTSSLSTDEKFSIDSMQSLALSLRNLRGSDVGFITVPVSGTGRSPDGKQSIVVLDTAADKPLFTAIRKDKVPAWVTSHQSALLGSSVN
jgi:LCP family protein required for cell wall assembly